MRPSVLVFSLVAAFSAEVARADCVPEDAAGPGADCITLNAGGVWLSDAKADDLSKRVAKLPDALRLSAAQAVELAAVRAALADRTTEATEMRRTAEAGHQAAVKLAGELEAERSAAGAWYRNPWLWFGVGVVVGGGGAVALAVATH